MVGHRQPFFYGMALGPATDEKMPITKRRFRTTAGTSGRARPETQNLVRNESNLGNVTQLLQQYAETTESPQTASTPATALGLQDQVNALKQIVTSWDAMLREITQSVFGCLATTTVGGLPYYTELPNNEPDLGAPRARLAEGQRVTLVYPQLQAAGFLFMRLRVTDPSTGEIEQFYVPVMSMAHQPTAAAKLLTIDGGGQEVTYFDNFHNPGETNPIEK